MGPVYARSDSAGDVLISVNGTGGHGAAGFRGEVGGDGGGVSGNGIFDGDTAGNLNFDIHYRAGNGGNGEYYVGKAADISLVHEKTTDSDSLTIDAYALAGNGGSSYGALPSEAGGNADVSVTGHNTRGDVSVLAWVRGGNGGANNSTSTELAGSGGNANASSIAHSDGDGAIVMATSDAWGGQTDSSVPLAQHATGSVATSSARATASGNSYVSAQANARASDSGNDMGDAEATAFAANVGSQPVRAGALAEGGNDGPRPGVGVATAYGESLGGGDVSVGAVQSTGQNAGGSRDNSMLNAVSGRATGHLTLGQRATAGGAGTNYAAGTATSVLLATNPLGGALTAGATAIGGEGTLNTAGPVAGGNAFARSQAVSELAALAIADARAGGAGTTAVGSLTGEATARAEATGRTAEASAVALGNGAVAMATARTNGVLGAFDSILFTADRSSIASPEPVFGSGAILLLGVEANVVIAEHVAVRPFPIAGTRRLTPSIVVVAPMDNEPYAALAAGSLLSPQASETLASIELRSDVSAETASNDRPFTDVQQLDMVLNLEALNDAGSLSLETTRTHFLSDGLFLLHVEARINDVVFLDTSFTEIADANDFFANEIFELGSVSALRDDGDSADFSLRYSLQAASGGQLIEFDLISKVAVPIPAAIWGFLSGLSMLGVATARTRG